MYDRAPSSTYAAPVLGVCALMGWALVASTACVVPSIGIGDTAAPADTAGDTSTEDDGSTDDTDTGRSLLGCSIKNVGDASDCPGDCNAAIEGAAGVFQCTVTCDATTQDCGEGYYCQIFADGGTACLGDCSNGASCPSGDSCDEVLSVCLPDRKTGSSSSNGSDDGPQEVSVVCDFAIVEDVTTCDDDCDQPVYTGDGLYVCTTECDVDLQDCPGPKYRCEAVNDGSAACFLDCSGGNACPGDDYACDQDLELCIPVR